MQAVPRVWFPSEEVEIVIRFTIEGIHHQRSEWNKYRRNDKNFHQLVCLWRLNIIYKLLQSVAMATPAQA